MTTPKTSILIKSYPADYGWLDACLRSIRKFVTGHHEVVVVVPEGCEPAVENERLILVKEWNDQPWGPHQPTRGYYYQMYVKLCADLHCPEAEAILFVDSDCIFKRPFDVSEMFEDGKAKILKRRWEESGDGICWKEPAEHALGVPCEWDFMTAFPMCYWADTVRKTREAIEAKHKQKLQYYMRQRRRCVEFVSLGNYAVQNEPERYLAINCGPDDGFPRPLQQFWSHGGFTESDAKVIEEILK